MTQPHQHIFRAIVLKAARNGGAVDHQDGQSQFPRGDQFSLGAAPSCILADDHIDGVSLHQCAVSCSGEWPAINNQAVTRQNGRLFGRVDETQQIVMLGLGGKGFYMHPAQRQHDAAGLSCQRGDRAVDVGNAGPSIPGDRLPGPPSQGDMVHASEPGSRDGMTAHRRGKGVCGVYQMGDAMVVQIIHQPRHTAKTTDSHWHWLSEGRVCPSGVAECRRDALCCEQSGERACLTRAAQQENMLHG